jgi:hypothetical protein
VRIRLSIDDYVAILLERLQRSRDVPLKQIVNEALRQGLELMSQSALVPQKPFRTHPVALGKRYYPNLDNTWEVLAEAEGQS